MPRSPENSLAPKTEQMPQDTASFEAFYKRLYPRLCSLAFTLLRNRIAAEDVVQEMFVSLWNRRGEIRITNSLESYVVRAVYLLCMREHNRQKVQSLDEASAHTHIDLSDITVDGLSDEEYARLTRLEQAIESLPAQCRTVFVMFKKDGLRQKEIASTLGISAKTVNNHILKAMKQIRLRMTGREGSVKKNRTQ